MTMLSENPMSVAAPVISGSERPTTQISRAELNKMLPSVHQLPFGLRMGKARFYTCIPLTIKTKLSIETPIWRIELHGIGLQSEPLGFDIVGDVILGRSAGSHVADVDLERFKASDHGVSRRHAMLRPSRNNLYLIDLESTNGTYCNAMRINCGMVRSITDRDTITLGNFSFEVRIIDWPGLRH